MTICFFTRLFYPHIGGVEKHVFEVSKVLIAQGHIVHIFTEELPPTKDTQTWHSGDESAIFLGKTKELQVHRLKVSQHSWLKKFSVWKALWKYRILIQDTDVVHCHDVFFWYLPFRFLYLHKKVFTTFHGYEGKYPPSKKAILVRRISEKLASGNICVGAFIKKWYGTQTNFITYGGVTQNTNTTQIAPSSKTLKLLFLGRLAKDNGVDIYLRALEDLTKKGVKFTLSVCGDGEYRDEFAKYGKMLPKVVNTTKYIQNNDIVFCSSYLSILEAMNEGRAVFAVYDNPLKEDYLKMTPYSSWIQIMNSHNDLSNKIEQYAQNSLGYTKIIRKAQLWANMQTWQRVTDMYLKLWQVKS